MAAALNRDVFRCPCSGRAALVASTKLDSLHPHYEGTLSRANNRPRSTFYETDNDIGSGLTESSRFALWIQLEQAVAHRATGRLVDVPVGTTSADRRHARCPALCTRRGVNARIEVDHLADGDCTSLTSRLVSPGATSGAACRSVGSARVTPLTDGKSDHKIQIRAEELQSAGYTRR